MQHDIDEPHDHDRGLGLDLGTLFERRRALKLFAGAGVLALVGCGSDDDATGSTTSSSGASSSTTAAASGSSTTAASGSCDPIPEETGGPYPADGTNGPNVLDDDGIVRQDIRSSVGSPSTTAEGVSLTINLALVDTGNGCTALASAAVYLWHCDRDGRYSLYTSGVEDESYLRGVQVADDDGNLSFTTIFPGAYNPRWPHIHFEVYANVDDAVSGGSPMVTSQLALPQSICEKVYAESGYEQSASNLAGISLERDMVFGDDAAVRQLATMSGSVDSGLTAALTVPV